MARYIYIYIYCIYSLSLSTHIFPPQKLLPPVGKASGNCLEQC